MCHLSAVLVWSWCKFVYINLYKYQFREYDSFFCKAFQGQVQSQVYYFIWNVLNLLSLLNHYLLKQLKLSSMSSLITLSLLLYHNFCFVFATAMEYWINITKEPTLFSRCVSNMYLILTLSKSLKSFLFACHLKKHI